MKFVVKNTEKVGNLYNIKGAFVLEFDGVKMVKVFIFTKTVIVTKVIGKMIKKMVKVFVFTRGNVCQK